MRLTRPFPVSHPLARAAALLLLGSGCATATRVAIGEDQRQQITSAQTVAGFSQPEIGAAIEVSSAGGAFGLIGALIDSGVNSTRAK